MTGASAEGSGALGALARRSATQQPFSPRTRAAPQRPRGRPGPPHGSRDPPSLAEMAANRYILLAASVAVLLAGPVSAVTDVDVLNFALNLECLEAQFYSFAAFGVGLDANLTGGGPAPVGGRKALLSPPTQAYAEEVATDEINHVAFLRSALGAAAVPCPAIDISTAFSAAANAALKTTLSPAFSPYDDDFTFLGGAFIFEDVGVTAYHGAAPLIVNKDYLSAAAGILAVEAYHAGLIRTLLTQFENLYAVPYTVKVVELVQAISDLRGSVDGSGDKDDQGIKSTDAPTPAVAPPSAPAKFNFPPTNIVPADANSIAYARTTSAVLNIVYLSAAGTPGGFFPNGLNGNIK